jgi:dienelactone hydrolase
MSAAVARDVAGETPWTLLSRGDRVHGRTWKPARRGRLPVVILCTGDGVGSGELVERARAAWSGRAALATFDLPLCGSRRSDKLSALALDPSQPLAARLRADLETQTTADLARVAALLRADPDLDPTRVSLVAVGLGARLARPFASGSHGLAAVELAPSDTPPSDDWLKTVGQRVAPEHSR